MSDTPRTDEQTEMRREAGTSLLVEMVPANFARQLERELAEAKTLAHHLGLALERRMIERDQWREVAHELEDLVDWKSWGWLGKTRLVYDKFRKLKEASRE